MSDGPAVGEPWAYRARRQDPLVEVVVLRLGVRRPPRILVRFSDDEFEGLQEWVSPARLKVPWADRDAFLARERRWDDVLSPSPDHDDPSLAAVDIVIDRFVDPALATVGYNATRGVLMIHDVDGLASHLNLDPRELRADPLSFEEEGDLIASFSLTSVVARRVAERDPDAVLRYVEREEVDARREAVFGHDYPSHGRSAPRHVSAEICARVDEEHSQPIRALLREWCGQEPNELRHELAALREEVARLTALLESATQILRRNGLARAAKRLERERDGEP